MEINKLRQLITKPEWTDVEVKTAATQYPKSALESVSAFANSGGGYLIFGVDENKPDPIQGVKDVDQVQNGFIGILKDTNKFNCIIRFNADLVELDGKQILVFQIEEALRHEKPIYLNGEMRKTFLRKGSRDDRATDEEIRRMIRDAHQETPDEQLLEIDAETCFDTSTIKWYRNVYESRHNQKHYELSDLEFLDQFALVKEKEGELLPSMAALLMFGDEKHVRRLLPRFTVDARWHNANLVDGTDGQRWSDRRTFECNLFDTWRQLADRFMYYVEQPFDIDENNLHRKSETPDYIGFREAAVNVLIHQDYQDKERSAVINFYKDASIYFNPGDSLIDLDRLGKGDSASRNPLIMQTFHRIGLSDRAGSGIKDIYNNWQQLDRPEPDIQNDKINKTFQLTLGKKSEVSDLQQALQQKIGVSLSQLQAEILIDCVQQPKTVEQLAESKGLESAVIYPVLDHLSRQGLVLAHEQGYKLAAHFQSVLTPLLEQFASVADIPKVTKLPESDQAESEKVTKLVSESDQAPIFDLSNKQQSLIAQLDGEMDLKQLMELLGQTHRTHFKNKQLAPLIDAGLVAIRHPDNPNHPEQAYRLTEMGLSAKQNIKTDDDG
jgi:ATP-dependent DNA helicase RecG